MTAKITQILKDASPKQLKPHPLNEEIYGDSEPSPEFLENVRLCGIIQPIVLAADERTVVSGHKRRKAAISIGLEAVKVIVRRDLVDKLDIERALILSNEQRENRSTEMRAREFKRLREIEEAFAARRQKAGKSVPKPTGGTDTPDEPLIKVIKGSSGVTMPPSGRASEIAAEAVGMSYPTAAKAEVVIDKIDELTERGHVHKAEELRETLEQNVSAAHRLATGEKPKTRKPRAPAEPCPNCGGKKWTDGPEGKACASCHEPYSTVANRNRESAALPKDLAKPVAEAVLACKLKATPAQLEALTEYDKDSQQMLVDSVLEGRQSLAKAIETGEVPEPTPDELLEKHNKGIASFCRELTKFFDEHCPTGVWMDDAGRRDTARQQIKSACATLNLAKCKTCPKCDGEGCKTCEETGMVPTGKYEQLK
jgi:hypothetical protein